MDKLIHNHNFNIRGQSEQEFEFLLSGAFSTISDNFSGVVISEIDKEAKIESVHFMVVNRYNEPNYFVTNRYEIIKPLFESIFHSIKIDNTEDSK